MFPCLLLDGLTSHLSVKILNFILQDVISITMGVSGTTCADVSQEFIKIDKEEKIGKKKMLHEVLENPDRNPAELVIVFVNKIEQAEFLVRILFDLLNKLGTGLPSADEYLKTTLRNSYFQLSVIYDSLQL